MTAPTDVKAAVLYELASAKYPRAALGDIAAKHGLTAGEVSVFVKQHGWPDPTAMRHAADRLTEIAAHDDELAEASRPGRRPQAPKPDLSTPTARAEQLRRTGEPIAAVVGAPPKDSAEDIIQRALNGKTPTMRKRGALMQLSMLKLKVAVENHESIVAKREAEAKRKAKVRAEIIQRERELRDLKDSIRKPGRKSTGPTQSEASGTTLKAMHDRRRGVLERYGVTNADLRRWATENGVACGPQGQIPMAVLDAYEAQHPVHEHTQTEETA